MQTMNNSRKARIDESDELGRQVPPYLSGVTRLRPKGLEVIDRNPAKFAIRVSGGIFTSPVTIQKTGRYLFLSDGGETLKALSEDFLSILFEESTDDSLLLEDYVRSVLADKHIQVTNSGKFQIVLPIPQEHECNALIGACFALVEGTAHVRELAAHFAAHREN